MTMKKEVIVLYPSPIPGHLVSMVEFGKLLLTHYPSFSVTVLVIAAPFETTSATPFVNRISAANTSINFHHLPDITLPSDSSDNYMDILYQIPLIQNPNFLTTIQDLSDQNSCVKAVILDFFSTAAFDICCTSLNIPTYFFFTSGASTLADILYFPTLDKKLPNDLKELKGYIQNPGLPPLNSADMTDGLTTKDSLLYQNYLITAKTMRKSAGLLCNTFDAFEPKAIKAILDGECVPEGPTPPFYGIGPLVASSNDRSEHECLSWLDLQPSHSVVFLCFGSMGSFSKSQLKDMAIGLENSGRRFLWVVRNPPTDQDDTNPEIETKEPDLDALLPEGFLERTKEKGYVLKSWAPQVDILSHESVGGFVTHCGWNSTLEAILAGVPMLAWPLYAEQRVNRVILVEELKVALSVKESDKDGFVSSDKLEKRLSELMEGEEGRVVRERVMEMREAAKAAIGEGGSARVAVANFVQTLKV